MRKYIIFLCMAFEISFRFRFPTDYFIYFLKFFLHLFSSDNTGYFPDPYYLPGKNCKELIPVFDAYQRRIYLMLCLGERECRACDMSGQELFPVENFSRREPLGK